MAGHGCSQTFRGSGRARSPGSAAREASRRSSNTLSPIALPVRNRIGQPGPRANLEKPGVGRLEGPPGGLLAPVRDSAGRVRVRGVTRTRILKRSAARVALVTGTLALSLLLSTVVRAEDAAPGSRMIPTSEELAEAHPEGAALTGREIYERYLTNKYRSSVQRLRVVSRDPGGSEQSTTFTVSLRDFRDEEDQPTNGVLAKMLIEVKAPFDMRHTSYLMIMKNPGPDDEFVYRPSERRVQRANLKGTSIMASSISRWA